MTKSYWLLLVLSLCIWNVQAKSPDQVRSAFLYQMAKFVEFPKSRTVNGLRFCFFTLDDGPGAVLQATKNLSINDLPIQILKIENNTNLRELSERCDISYVDENHENDILSAWTDTTALDTVTVGESLAFLEGGGVASLVQEGSKIRLYINKQAMNKHNFKVLSRLLAVAKFHPD
ncbi:YfiR family protein [Pseudoalteromonas fenneropenaei]|uniref:YfiR family protein n=1 Tax=Pseudoalteromonas fenneropenaei TaxID=1737459 RepID=A0ABV7CE55_9GAMM